MEDFPTRLADLLEGFATKVRALTVDRATKAVTLISMAIPLVVFALLAVVFLFMTIHGALAIPLTDAGAHAVMAGLFAVGGVLLWRKRTREPEDET